MDDGFAAMILGVILGMLIGVGATCAYKHDVMPVKYIVIEQNQLVKQ